MVQLLLFCSSHRHFCRTSGQLSQFTVPCLEEKSPSRAPSLFQIHGLLDRNPGFPNGNNTHQMFANASLAKLSADRTPHLAVQTVVESEAQAGTLMGADP